jgi:predicted aspartyl protease
MKTAKEKLMGRIDVTVKLANYEDVRLKEKGKLGSQRVRTADCMGVVDTGAARLVLPKRVADELELSPAGTANVRYADQRKAKRQMVKNVWLELNGRSSVFSAIVELKRETALVGAIVLEELDLVADCTTQSVHPRDPRGIVSEIE